MKTLEEEFFEQNQARYDPDTLETWYPKEGPDGEPEEAPEQAPIQITDRKPIIPAEAPKAATAAEPKTEKGWRPNFLAAAAAFTQNPALMQMLSDRRKAAADGPMRELKAEEAKNAIEESKRRALMAREAANPQSAASAKMREEMAQNLAVMGEAIPTMKPRLDGIASALGKMSAADMMGMQERLGGIFKLVRGVQHDRATEAMAGKKLEQGERQIAATIADKAEGRQIARATLQARLDELAEKRAERQDNQDEKDAANLGKDIAPLNETEALINEAKQAKQKVNTGEIASRIQNGLKWLGLANDDYLKLETIQGTLNNQIFKLQSGGTITDDESRRLLQQVAALNQDDNEFDIKLAQMMDTVKLKQNEVKAAHPRAAAKAAAKKPPAQKASSAPHGNTVKQNGHTFQWNGQKYVQVD
jgi:hypothetical protein